jgi:hypothetical protein
MYLNRILFPSEIVLGEHRTDTDPDCASKKNGGKCIPPKISTSIEEIIIHESYTKKGFKNDIALIRLDQEVKLYSEDAGSSCVMPICLPWDKDDPYRQDIYDLSGDSYYVHI